MKELRDELAYALEVLERAHGHAVRAGHTGERSRARVEQTIGELRLAYAQALADDRMLGLSEGESCMLLRTRPNGEIWYSARGQARVAQALQSRQLVWLVDGYPHPTGTRSFRMARLVIR